MSEFVQDDDEKLLARAINKAVRGEIDSELRALFATMISKGMSPILCDQNGNKVIPGRPIPSGFTVRVGTLSCTSP